MVNLTERRVTIPGADSIHDERSLPGHAMSGLLKRLFPVQLFVRHRRAFSADLCNKRLFLHQAARLIVHDALPEAFARSMRQRSGRREI